MEEQNIGTSEMDKGTVPVGEAMPIAPTEPQPAQMPTPTPMPAPAPQMPASPVVPVMPTESQQPIGNVAPVAPTVERMEMPMQPIDLSGQSEMPIQPGTPEEGGGKKKMIIIAIVVFAGLAVGLGAFFVWRMMNAPAEEVPVVEQPIAAPILPPVSEQVVIPAAPELDDISVVEQELNAFNAATIDMDLQNGLNEISKAL